MAKLEEKLQYVRPHREMALKMRNANSPVKTWSSMALGKEKSLYAQRRKLTCCNEVNKLKRRFQFSKASSSGELSFKKCLVQNWFLSCRTNTVASTEEESTRQNTACQIKKASEESNECSFQLPNITVVVSSRRIKSKETSEDRNQSKFWTRKTLLREREISEDQN
jgi:hypothetical protein